MYIDSYYTQVSHFTAFQNFQSSVAKQEQLLYKSELCDCRKRREGKSTLETGAQEANDILHYFNKHTHKHIGYWLAKQNKG